MHGIFLFDTHRLAAPLDQQPLGLYWIADRPLWQMIVSCWGSALTTADIWVPDAAAVEFQGQVVQFPLPIEVRVHRYSARLDNFPAALIGETAEQLPAGPLIVATDEAIVLPPKRFEGQLDVRCGAFGPSALYFAHSQTFIDQLPRWDKPLASWMDIFDDVVPLEADKLLPLQAENQANGRFFEANHQLLTIGYGSDDALERSYVEEFAVIPPVYIAPDAEIYTSVIGPYASIGPRSRVENVIVRQTVVDRDCTVQNVLLEQSLIAANSHIQGQFSQLQTQMETGIAIGGQFVQPHAPDPTSPDSAPAEEN